MTADATARDLTLNDNDWRTTMRHPRFTTLAMAIAMAATLSLSACDDEPDSAGEAIEDAGESLGDAVDEAGDNIGDAAEEAGDRIEEKTD